MMATVEEQTVMREGKKIDQTRAVIIENTPDCARHRRLRAVSGATNLVAAGAPNENVASGRCDGALTIQVANEWKAHAVGDAHNVIQLKDVIRHRDGCKCHLLIDNQPAACKLDTLPPAAVKETDPEKNVCELRMQTSPLQCRHHYLL